MGIGGEYSAITSAIDEMMPARYRGRTDVWIQWTVDAYTLTLASFLILSGSTGDRVGRRKVFQTGLVLFTLGSLLCSLAPGLDWLVAFRVLQAIGGSMLNPVALSIVSNTFTDAAERARAIGI
jgi:MFS family permease